MLPAHFRRRMKQRIRVWVIAQILVPPWVKYPHITRYSIGWRMGYGDAYMESWWSCLGHRNRRDMLSYFRYCGPIPLEWLDWVASVCGFTKPPGTGANDVYSGVQWLQRQGLADFQTFRTWYETERLQE